MWASIASRKPNSVGGAFCRIDLIHILSGLFCFVLGYSGKHPEMARDLRAQNRREQNLNELSFISFPCIIFS